MLIINDVGQHDTKSLHITEVRDQVIKQMEIVSAKSLVDQSANEYRYTILSPKNGKVLGQHSQRGCCSHLRA